MALLFAVLLLADFVIVFRLWNAGWPKEIVLSSPTPGVEQVTVKAISFTHTDWLILVIAASIHVALLYSVRKAWRSPSIRV
ncbi:MAG: hypothetical protein ACK6D7_02315 [Acidobacteriota bacterium]